MASEGIRVGLIGAGKNTRDRHIPGFQKVDGLDITAVANRSLESGQVVADQFNIPNVYANWQDLLEDPRFVSAEYREGHDIALAGELERVSSTREPLEWEALLTAADVACVKAEDRGPFHFFDEDAHVK